jgi:inner membrane protein
MDNLTHSLAGAVLGQMGLKTKTGLAMPTLIIAANLPDIDAVAMLLGGHQHLALRRGITHGPIAMLILPIILWAIMLAWDKWRPSEKRLPVHKGWLLALAYIGTLSHPALDWLNVYGIRLLEPFSSQWFYGDTLFIIDVWVWAALLISVIWSIRRERRGLGNWQRPAWVGFAAICAYIFANGLITRHAVNDGYAKLPQRQGQMADNNRPFLVVANAVPIRFWQRDMVWQQGAWHGEGEYSLDSGVFWHSDNRNVYPDVDLDTLAKKSSDLRAFLFWSRIPIVKEEKDGRVTLYDLRFMDFRVRERFSVPLGMVDSLGITAKRQEIQKIQDEAADKN